MVPSANGWSVARCVGDEGGAIGIEARRADGAVVELVIALAGAADALVRTPAGDVSYRGFQGLAANEAVAFARAFAQALPATPLARDFPHLAARPPVDRDASTARPTSPFDAAHLAPLLEPALRVGEAFAGFQLRAIVDEPTGGCALEFTGPQDRALLVGRGRAGFPAGGELRVALRRGPAEVESQLPYEVARLCSHVAALLRERDVDARLRSTRPAAHATDAPRARTQSSSAIDEDLLEPHLFAIRASSYTIVPGVVRGAELAQLSADLDRALDRARAVTDAGQELEYAIYDTRTYIGTRCLYCWGDVFLRLLENPVVRGLADTLIGPHRLYDLMGQSLLPGTEHGRTAYENWHRDIDVTADSSPAIRYLWFAVAVDDFTPENGATWIVPGSHRLTSVQTPLRSHALAAFPSRTQLTARAGDLIVFNPSALHTWGSNTTDRARRMVNISLCHAEVRPIIDHWVIAGPAIQARASDRLREVLGAERIPPPIATFSALPPGWITGDPTAAAPAAATWAVREQQGVVNKERLAREQPDAVPVAQGRSRAQAKE